MTACGSRWSASPSLLEGCRFRFPDCADDPAPRFLADHAFAYSVKSAVALCLRCHSSSVSSGLFFLRLAAAPILLSALFQWFLTALSVRPGSSFSQSRTRGQEGK